MDGLFHWLGQPVPVSNGVYLLTCFLTGLIAGIIQSHVRGRK